jgi:hypothetical protein
LVVARIGALAGEPRPQDVEKLAGGGSRWRVRQGAYRIVYEIDEAERRVVAVWIGHRPRRPIAACGSVVRNDRGPPPIPTRRRPAEFGADQRSSVF